MAPKKEKERVITLDDKKYDYSEMNNIQQIFTNHVSDLDNKINNARWNLDQLMGGRDFFMDKLKAELNHVSKDMGESIEK